MGTGEGSFESDIGLNTMAEPGSLGVIRGLTALIIALIVAYGLRAYLATRRRSLLSFIVGLATAGTGYLLEGVLVELLGWGLPEATLVESTLSLVAFAFLVASLFVREARRAVAHA